MPPATQYARADDTFIAYQEFGHGPVDLVLVPGFISNIENYGEDPALARWLGRLGEICRVTMFDKRGTGLSDRAVSTPGVDQRLDDVTAVMDAAGLKRAVLMGISEGGTLAALHAAHHPERCLGLVLYGAFAQIDAWFPTRADFDAFLDYVRTRWGSGESLPAFGPSMAGDEAYQHWWGRFERLGATPGAAIQIMELNYQLDIRDLLPSVHVPTLVVHRSQDVTIDVAGGRELAASIEGARMLELPGRDHLPWIGENSEEILLGIAEFLTGERPAPPVDRVLATVLFTDLVDSTAQAGSLGDRAWRDKLDAHDRIVRRQLATHRGREVKHTGDGFLATFDAPARAIRCARAIRGALRPTGLRMRAGVHTGEVELGASDVRGIAVNLAARIADLGDADEVLVSRTVRDLVAGSGIVFEDLGEHPLKGLAEDWRILRVAGEAVP